MYTHTPTLRRTGATGDVYACYSGAETQTKSPVGTGKSCRCRTATKQGCVYLAQSMYHRDWTFCCGRAFACWYLRRFSLGPVRNSTAILASKIRSGQQSCRQQRGPMSHVNTST
jgi:hypothetical protein